MFTNENAACFIIEFLEVTVLMFFVFSNLLLIQIKGRGKYDGILY